MRVAMVVETEEKMDSICRKGEFPTVESSSG